MDGFIGWIETLSDFVDPLSAGVYATVLAVVVGAINVVFRRWLTAGQIGLLWGLVLLRLLVPTGPGSALSLESLVSGTIEYFESSTGSGDSTAVGTGAAAGPANRPHVERDATQAALAKQPAAGQSAIWDYLLRCLPAIWFAGGIGGLMFTLATYWRFHSRVGQEATCADRRLCGIWEECCQAAGVRRRTRLVVFGGVDQPAIMGVFRPTLLLPPETGRLSDEQLRLVMLHELGHVRRGDIAANWLLVAIRAVHWWNPIYWLAAARFRSLQEQACDAFVVRRMAGEPVGEYRDLLLMFAEQRPSDVWRVSLPASILGFLPAWFRRRSLKSRLKALPSAAVRQKRWQAGAAGAVVLVVGVSGLTNAKVDERAHESTAWSQPVRGMRVRESYRMRPRYTGPVVERRYEIRAALAQMAKQEKVSLADSPDKVRRMLTSLLKLMYPESSVAPRNSFESATEASEPLDSPRIKFELAGDQLIVQAPVELQEDMARSLAVWAESGFGQICVTSRIITSNRDLTTDRGITWEHIEAISSTRGEAASAEDGREATGVGVEHRVEDYLPVAFAKLDEEQSAALVEAAHGDRSTSVLNAPKITTFNGQEAMLVDCTQRPFVVGVTPVVGEQAVALQPKIETIDEGTKITLRSVESRDRKTIRLNERIEMTSVSQVDTATASVRGQQVTIQIPQVQRHVLRVDTEIKDGESLLVGCLPNGGERGYQYFLITVRSVE